MVSFPPVVRIFFAALCFVAYLFLRFTKWGRFIYMMGDNPLGARVTGIPTRPMMLLQYVLAALIAFLASADARDTLVKSGLDPIPAKVTH